MIIPVYDAMPYLTGSVESAIGQTLGQERLEVIAVDDGSTDGSGDELERLASIHPCLRVFHQENSGGPSRPQNVALDAARGRFVFFLGADDQLAADALERMLALAEREGSDVVLGKMAGLGGRPTPKSMFRRTQPRADLFDSNVYRSLSCSKLFRRDLVERLGLRFREDLPTGQDQPFSATAYLHASVISVLADRPCVYILYREDGRNITFTRRDLFERMRVVDVMLPLLAEHLEPGPRRSRLMLRHFDYEVMIVLDCLLAEPDAARRDAAFSRIREWLADWCDDSIEERLSAMHRVCFALIRAGRLDELLEVVRYRQSGAEPDTLVEDGRVYARLPYFRDPRADVPDGCFEVTDRVSTVRRLDRAEWRRGSLELSFLARLTLLPAEDSRTSLVLRERGSGQEHHLPVRPGFDADIEPGTAADGRPLPVGLWDVSVRVAGSGIVREGRLGASRSESVVADPDFAVMRAEDGSAVTVVSYFTDPYGNLTLDVGDRWSRAPEPPPVERARASRARRRPRVIRRAMRLLARSGLVRRP